MADDRPVATGLLALAGVGLVVGLLLSGATLAVTQVLGLGDGGGSTSTAATARQSMYLPTPSPTALETGPLLTLAPDPADSASAAFPSNTPSPVAAPDPTIALSASTTAAAPGETVTLSGVYPTGEGATLIVERLTDGAWAQFVDVSTTVSGGTFSTYIRTSQPGDNSFRMRDAATGLTSNEVTFTIG